jgi:CheY-like chemotaxis protein
MSDLDHGFSAGILQPADLELLQQVFDKITAQVWFSPDPVRRREFASYILGLYRRGMVVPEKLESLCMAAARARFASDAGLSSPQDLQDCHVLVVEDEPLLAHDIEKRLAKVGATVVGPAGNLKDAIALADIGPLDMALLDIALDGETVFPVAALLKMKHIPFVFVSGQDKPNVPAAFRHVPIFPKPADWAKVAAFLAR